MRYLIYLLLLLTSVSPVLQAEIFYVNHEGKDDPDRDGTRVQKSWRTLAYAAERIPAGDHLIRLGQGVFEETKPIVVKSGIKIIGKGRGKKQFTEVRAATTFPLSEDPCSDKDSAGFLFVFNKVAKNKIENLIISSPKDRRIRGGLFFTRSQKITLKNLHVREFRWAGIHIEYSNQVELSESTIENASTEKCRFHNGLIRTKWLKHSEIHHNKIISTVGKGYGYKGGGHEGVRIHHNHIEVEGGFSIESAHENEFGVEIDHNYANKCISIPKGGPGADPKTRGFKYSFWIHDNYLTDSYTIEGPRNHLRFNHNYVHIKKTNGRVYTHHGGKNHGPIWIHNNIIENVDRAFIWMNRGLAENIFVYNNTVFFADAGNRSGNILGAYSGERLNNWVVKNNIFICAWSQPRRFFSDKRGVDKKIVTANNLLINVLGVPDGNFVEKLPELKREGRKPWPFYQPKSKESWIIEKGVDVGLPFSGKVPTLGAYTWNETRPWTEIPELLKK